MCGWIITARLCGPQRLQREPEIDGATESNEAPKVEQMATPRGLPRAISAKMVLKISGVMIAFIDPRLGWDG